MQHFNNLTHALSTPKMIEPFVKNWLNHAYQIAKSQVNLKDLLEYDHECLIVEQDTELFGFCIDDGYWFDFQDFCFDYFLNVCCESPLTFSQFCTSYLDRLNP